MIFVMCSGSTEVGEGREAFDDLPFADLWNGVGCGGSQKCEIAQLDSLDLMRNHILFGF